MGLIAGKQPCIEVVCDNCGEGDNPEWGGSYHYSSGSEAIDALESNDWTVIARSDTPAKLYCYSCWDEMSDEERAEAQK